MIVPMKKVSLLVLKKYEIESIGKLKKLGVMHVESSVLKDSKDRISCNADLGAMERTLNALMLYKGKGNFDRNKAVVEFGSGENVVQRAASLFDENDKLNQKKEELQRDIQALTVWGNFNRDDLNMLNSGGMHVYLCFCADKRMRDLQQEFPDCVFEIISSAHGQKAFAVISCEELDQRSLPIASLPRNNRSLDELKNEIKKTVRSLKINHQQLLRCGKALPLIREYMAGQQEKIEFMQTRDSMQDFGEVAVLQGFVPVTDIESLQNLAKESGWGLLAEDPEPGVDVVPTMLKTPRWVKTIKPLFDFLAISPGYDELDVSGAVMIFFTLFFGILIGDAGYGAVFFLISLIGFLKNRSNPAPKAVFKLVLLLSIAAIAWGAATGNYFGLSWGGLEALTSMKVKDQNTQLVCFFLGFVQMCAGHFWRALVNFKWRNVGAQLGWILVMVANFILVDKMLVRPGSAYPQEMIYLYIAGVALIAICEVNWKDAGSIFGFPSNIINSFVDLLSYIRLFAVGMAGYYLAASFNMMAGNVMGSGVVGIIAGIIILLLGHSLNIALAILSVLVHGVRLNTLEFSNHVGLQWAGFAYKPFAERNKTENK